MEAFKQGIKPFFKIVALLACVALVPHVFVYFTAHPYLPKKPYAHAQAHKGYHFLKVLSHLKRIDSHEDVGYEYSTNPESLSVLEYQWIQFCVALAQRENNKKNRTVDSIVRTLLMDRHNAII